MASNPKNLTDFSRESVKAEHQEISRSAEPEHGMFTYTCNCGYFITTETEEQCQQKLKQHIEQQGEQK